MDRYEEITAICQRLQPQADEVARRLEHAVKMSREGRSDLEVAEEARPIVDLVLNPDFDRLLRLLKEES